MQVTLIMAMTADGKTARVNREAPRFGEADRARLHRLCAAADVLVMGGGALRAEGVTVELSAALQAERVAAGRPPQPTTCIVSRRAELPLDRPFFARQQVPRVVVVPDEQTATAAAHYGDLAEVWAGGPGEVDLPRFADQLAARGWSRVVLLSGGGFNAAWMACLPIHRFELTLAPWWFGGATAPSPLDGAGLPEPRRLELVASEAGPDGLLFLSYDVGP